MTSFFSRCSSQSVLSFNQLFIITSFSFDFSFNVLVRVFIKCSKIFLINKLITSDICGLQQNTIIQLISCTYHFKSSYIFDKSNFYFISYFCIEIFLEIEWVFILNNIVITWTLKFVLKIQPLIKYLIINVYLRDDVMISIFLLQDEQSWITIIHISFSISYYLEVFYYFTVTDAACISIAVFIYMVIEKYFIQFFGFHNAIYSSKSENLKLQTTLMMH